MQLSRYGTGECCDGLYLAFLWVSPVISRDIVTYYCMDVIAHVLRAPEKRTRRAPLASFELRAGIPRSPGPDDAIAANPGWAVPGQVLREGNLAKLGN